MTDVADVVVVGGGPAGCATGLALARAGYSVEVVERHPEAYRCVGEVLPPAIRQPLTVLGLWDEFLASSALPSYGVRSVWGGHTAAHRSFLFDPQGPGWHVDRAEFDAMLRRSAVAAGAKLVQESSFLGIGRSTNRVWDIVVEEPNGRRPLRARFVVDASGRSRVVCRRLGIRICRADRMIARVAYAASIATVTDLLIESTMNGWRYAAPIPGDRTVFVSLTDADLLREDFGRDAPWPISDSSIAGDPGIDERRWAPKRVTLADSSYLSSVYGEGWMAVGDAAASHDPLAARGLDRALRSGLRAAFAIAESLHQRSAALAEYASVQTRSFASYLEERRHVYALEQRWAAAPFWARRLASGAAIQSF